MLPLIVTVEQLDGASQRYAFADSPVSIGRSPFAELQLSQPFISRWEGTLRFDEREITYFSLGTTNSTYLNGESITAQETDIPIDVNSVLRLGELTLRFAREPVPDADLRRKGKRRPTREDSAVAFKTVYLDPAEAWGKFVPAPEVPPTPARVASAAGDAALPSAPAAPLAQPGLPLSAAESQVASVEPSAGPAALSGTVLHAYRHARAAVLAEAKQRFAALPEAERTRWLTSLLAEEPTLVLDAELSAQCHKRGVRTLHDIPELHDWLRAIVRDVLPGDVQFDTRSVLTRVLGLVEVLVQSLAEIHDAQDSVRKRWIGQSARRSVLQSDKGNLVLAYLLNPQADWNERLRELEQSVRDVVTHELALFKATLEGARALVDSVAPEAIAQAEAGAQLQAGEQGPNDSFWARLLGKPPLDARLWQRFTATHADLKDGERYERVFLGRLFARAYLAAMGKPRTDV